MEIGFLPLVRILVFLAALSTSGGEEIVIENYVEGEPVGSFIAIAEGDGVVTFIADDGARQETFLVVEAIDWDEAEFSWEIMEADAGSIDLSNELEQIEYLAGLAPEEGFELLTDDGDEWYVELTGDAISLESYMLGGVEFIMELDQ